MKSSRTDEALFREIARETGVDASQVKRSVLSFFDVSFLDAKRLPFSSKRKIFKRVMFGRFAIIRSIPFIGRLGASYTRYLAWKRNDARDSGQVMKSIYRNNLTNEDIERYAAEILSGGSPEIRKRKSKEMYDRVWIVGEDGKRQARQVIPKENTDGIQDS